MSMFLDIVTALLALGMAAVWILTARGELTATLSRCDLERIFANPPRVQAREDGESSISTG
jgi:hypothetical protein